MMRQSDLEERAHRSGAEIHGRLLERAVGALQARLHGDRHVGGAEGDVRDGRW